MSTATREDYLWEYCLTSDPTLKFFLREAKIETPRQIELYGSALKIAMTKYMDQRIKESF